MKKILPEYNFTEEDLGKVDVLAATFNLLPETVKIMYGRGIQTEDQMRRFLNPSRENFEDPFKMKGMREAVDLITKARDEDWCVVIYGDYDADGIDATTIMARNLAEFGIQPILFIPERADGYGLSIDNIDKIFDEYCPELIITVDCGISAREEIEYIKECGALVICTDHHELPEELPDCICINPKIEDDYPYDNLCGAGVAFKVGCALNGNSIGCQYLDFAAIATVADSVPLTGENRDIVAEGLKVMNSSPRECYTLLLNDPSAEINSQTISFYLAPRINAAGRMGHAREALWLFNETDPDEVKKLAKHILKYNEDRKIYTDKVEKEAGNILAEKDHIGKCILLCGADWSPGFVGVVAARIAEEYSRPVMLLTRSGRMMKGSARSVGTVNIFEAIKACSQYFEEYGGHSMAAGVSIKAENFQPLEKALDEYLSANYADEDFASVVRVCDGVESRQENRFVHELKLLEPVGMGNKSPMFHRAVGRMRIGPMKKDSDHLFLSSDTLDYKYFSGARFMMLFKSPAVKDIYFEYDVSSFRGRESISGLVRDVSYNGRKQPMADETIAFNSLFNLTMEPIRCRTRYIYATELKQIAEQTEDFGTVFVASDMASARRFFCMSRFPVELFSPAEKSSATIILVSPEINTDFSPYKTVIFLDDPRGIVYHSLLERDVLIVKDGLATYLKDVNTDREAMLDDFRKIRLECYKALCDNAFDATTVIHAVKPLQCAFDITVFCEIGIMTFTRNKYLEVVRGAKGDLNNSLFYRRICQMKKEGGPQLTGIPEDAENFCKTHSEDPGS
ncbi:MAG: single-stranded-DNA-specific exonuclease RecJ [Clostridia bacterium]|nr:single-stranded-DNA-specific exonuclease RecJ [Clostridia bacterium]